MTDTLTPDRARSFDYFSRTNADILTSAALANGCACQPYVDWFTYQRWQAQGFQVRKGQHGISLITWVGKDPDPDTNAIQLKSPRKRRWRYTAFCRCQVDPKETRT